MYLVHFLTLSEVTVAVERGSWRLEDRLRLRMRAQDEGSALRTQHCGKRLESLSILLTVLFLRLGDPILPLDPFGGGVEFLRDLGDIFRFPPRYLDIGV